MSGRLISSITRRALATAALAATFAMGTIAVATPASAASPRDPGAVHTLSVSCGYYSGTALTVYGDSGDRVKEAQCLLVYWGYSVGSYGIDGKFGSSTLAAVKAFQTQTYGYCGAPGLVSDGKIGAKTWSALRADNGCPTV